MKTISLAKFITRYLGIKGDGLKYLTHDYVKVLFPNLKRASFAYVENNPKEIINGNVLLVDDNFKVIPYFTPKLNLCYEDCCIDHDEDEKYNHERVENYTELSIYELKKLLNVKFNGYHNSRYARRELEDRGVKLRKKYNREEFKKWRKDYERD